MAVAEAVYVLPMPARADLKQEIVVVAGAHTCPTQPWQMLRLAVHVGL